MSKELGYRPWYLPSVSSCGSESPSACMMSPTLCCFRERRITEENGDDGANMMQSTVVMDAQSAMIFVRVIEEP